MNKPNQRLQEQEIMVAYKFLVQGKKNEIIYGVELEFRHSQGEGFSLKKKGKEKSSS